MNNPETTPLHAALEALPDAATVILAGVLVLAIAVGIAVAANALHRTKGTRR